jgi:hypothetical protein
MQTPSPLTITSAIILFVLFFATLWCAVIFLIGRISGWALLAKRFRTDSQFPGQLWTWQSARFRWGCNFNNCLTVGAGPSGLYLSMLFLFRIGSPPLLIPWQEVTIRQRRTVLFFQLVELQLGREEQIPFTIREKLADSLRSAAGSSWPIEPIA